MTSTPNNESPELAAARTASAAAMRAAERIAIVTHVRPDGDALGCLLGLGHALERLGKQVTLVCDDGVVSAFAFMPGAARVLRKPPADAVYDLLVLVDCGDFERGGDAARALGVPGRTIVNIDHHVTNTRFGAVNWVDPDAASAAQLVLALLDELPVALDTEIATCLMVGLLTDTQGFRTSSVTGRALEAGARLAAAGASVPEIVEHTLNRRSYRSVQLWALALADMRLEPPGLAWSHITQPMRRACVLPEGGEGGLVSFMLSADEVSVSALFLERADGQVEMSFRAKPGFDVSGVARKLGGGGHPPAAGCMIAGPLVAAEQRALVELRQALAAQKTPPSAVGD